MRPSTCHHPIEAETLETLAKMKKRLAAIQNDCSRMENGHDVQGLLSILFRVSELLCPQEVEKSEDVKPVLDVLTNAVAVLHIADSFRPQGMGKSADWTGSAMRKAYKCKDVEAGYFDEDEG